MFYVPVAGAKHKIKSLKFTYLVKLALNYLYALLKKLHCLTKKTYITLAH